VVAASPSLLVGGIDNVGEHEATAAVLRYADRVRALTPAELALEIASLGEPGNQPLRQMQLALALTHSNQPVETARALGLLQRVAANASSEAAPYRSLARLIAHRLMEQRKLEDALERHAQQLREQQRRIEQLNERLEAMRAIERSLNNRAPARPAAP
jgi:DNA repair ATPase RecN